MSQASRLGAKTCAARCASRSPPTTRRFTTRTARFPPAYILRSKRFAAPMANPNLDWPLMRENVSREDLAALRYFLGQDGREVPRLTHGAKVEEFEQKFAQWLGSKFAVMVNSG